MVQVNKLAHEFRSALEIVRKERLYGRLRVFQHFPEGCCGYTSNLLAEYFHDNGIAVKYVVSGETSREQYSHCWIILENDTIVDITADQFNEKTYFKDFEPIPKCCIVSSRHPLYSLFDRQIEASTDYGIDSYSGELIRQQLQGLYNTIIQLIDGDLSH